MLQIQRAIRMSLGEVEEGDTKTSAVTDPASVALSATTLPEEPSKNCELPIATLRFIFPDSSRLQRRFYATDSLGVSWTAIYENEDTG